MEERKLFSFLGIYNTIDRDFYTCSIITSEANDFFAEVHNKKKRMPLVLEPNFEGEWLNPNLNDNGIQEILDTGFMRELFKAHQVTRDLYKRGINTNTPEILEKVGGEP